MDLLASLLNESASGLPLNMNPKEEENLPNFDHLLNNQSDSNQQQQQGQRPFQRAKRRNSALFRQSGGILKTKNLDDPAATSTDIDSENDVRRLHPTEMKRYLTGLMQSQNNQMPPSRFPEDKQAMFNQMKMQGGGGGFSQDGGMMGSMVAKNSFMKNNNSGNDGYDGPGYDGGQSSQQQRQQQGSGMSGAGSNNASRTSTPGNNQPSGNINNNKPSGNGNDLSRSNSGGNTNDDDFGRSAPNTTANSNSSNSRQKNDKAVEVHHSSKVIARFRTQTECARYLRATPEAVSYHCSKGGGICNGLVIRPLNASDTQPHSNDDSFFGLFEGATEFRPSQRPQLKPETVAILKDWLLSPEHVDNPYPNQRESEMLMEKTGLDKTQLKHWFNNARKRILKPLLKNGALGSARMGSFGNVGAGGMIGSKRKDSGDSGLDSSSRSTGKKKKRKGSEGQLLNQQNQDGSSLICGSISAASSHSTHKMSENLSSHQGRQYDDSYQDQQQQQGGQGQDFHHSNSGSTNSTHNTDNANANGMGGMGMGGGGGMMHSNQYERLMGFNSSNMGSGGGGMMSQRGMMMGDYGDSMMGGGMGSSMMNSRMMNSRDRMRGMDQMDSFHGSSGGYGNNSERDMMMYCRSSTASSTGGPMGGGGGGFQGCMEVGNDPQGFDGGRFNSDYFPSRGNSGGSSGRNNRQGYHRDNGSFNNNANNNDNMGYCQPLSSYQGNTNSMSSMRQQNQDKSPDESARSNAVFKQQVATMAMNEASSAFKEMEDAFAHAKDLTAQVRREMLHTNSSLSPEDDPMVMEANARAKKCQSVAMFKLKVSQRASEEAANAYDCYQRMVEGSVGGGGGGGIMGRGGGGDMGGMGGRGGGDMGGMMSGLGRNDDY